MRQLSFKIKVNDTAIFEWKDDTLTCSDSFAMEYLKDMSLAHIPKVVAMPDLIDFDDDLTDGRNAYYAIIGLFDNHEVLEEPTEEFLDYGYVEGRIY